MAGLVLIKVRASLIEHSCVVRRNKLFTKFWRSYIGIILGFNYRLIYRWRVVLHIKTGWNPDPAEVGSRTWMETSATNYNCKPWQKSTLLIMVTVRAGTCSIRHSLEVCFRWMLFVNTKQKVALRAPKEFGARSGNLSSKKGCGISATTLMYLLADVCITHEIKLLDIWGITLQTTYLKKGAKMLCVLWI